MRKSLFIVLAAFTLAIASLPVSVAQASQGDCGHCWTSSDTELGCGDGTCDDFHRATEWVYYWYRYENAGQCYSYCGSNTSYTCTQDDSCGGVMSIGCDPFAITPFQASSDPQPPSDAEDYNYSVVMPDGFSQDDVVLIQQALATANAKTADEVRQILSTDTTLPSWAKDIQVYDPPE